MKQNNFLKITLLLFLNVLLSINTLKAQATGDIAFVGFNSDNDDDFSLVALADIAPSTTIFIKDNSGFLTWDTGASIIYAGTVINFTDVNSNTNPLFGVSIGSILYDGNFEWSSNGEAIYIYVGTDKETPTTYISGMINSKFSHNLTGTGLTAGINFLKLNLGGNTDDGGLYSGSRSDQTIYSDYLSNLVNASNWSVESSTGDAFLPFPQVSFTLNSTEWTGAINNVWNLAGNWNNGIPTKDSNIIIPDTANDPIITSSLNTGNITLNTNANLTITGSITNKGLTNINSGATLISTGTLSGTVTYNRALTNGSQWYYMSSPVVGGFYDRNWVAANSILHGSLNTNNRGLSTYDNTSLDTDDDTTGPDTATGNWRYMEYNGNNKGTFNVGQGYGIIRDGSGTVSFTGTGLYTASQVIGITQGASTHFNLVGNPFTAYLNLGDFFTDNNGSVIKDASAYFWNGSGYDTKTSGLHSDFEVAPGQGFFVEAAADTNLTFDFADVTHQTTESFQKSSRPEVHLFLSDGKNKKYADIYYIDGTTTGYDNGYDGKLFGGVEHSFALFSHLVTDSEGKNFQIQSLPNSNYENMVIPIGLKIEANKEITFSAEALNLPADINVYLEDRLTNTFTRLDEANSSYKISSDVALDGIGRFYLHTKNSSSLSVDTVNMDNISIYKTTNSNLRIAGISQGKASIKLYSILGKQVFEDSFTSNGVQNITIPALSSGIYIVQLETETGSLNKKITLE